MDVMLGIFGALLGAMDDDEPDEGFSSATANIAVAQIEVTPGRPDLMEIRIKDEIAAAAKRGVDIIVFPEMCVPGYVLGDRFEDDDFCRDIVSRNEQIIAYTSQHDVVVIFGSLAIDEEAIGEDGRLRKYNAAFVAQDGQLVSDVGGRPFVVKTLHPNYRIFDDDRHFYSERKRAAEDDEDIEDVLQSFELEIKGEEVSVGIMLCEDMWDGDYSLSPGRILSDNGAEILINLSCSPWSWRKNQKRHRVVRELLEYTRTWFVYVNNVGVQNNGKNFVTFDGSSTVYDPDGNIIAVGDPYEDGVFDVLLEEGVAPVSEKEPEDVAQLYNAIRVATNGYLKTVPKTSRQKVIIGISGGIDSANSAALFADLLGPERVVGVNMPYKGFNSAETRDDAKLLAERLGIEYRVVPIDEAVDAVANTLGIQVGTSEHKSVQARMRMEVLAAIASIEGAIFTCNANKTEVAFGYGTLNGDLRGNFAPWMDCLKREVYQVADYINRVVYGREVIPCSIIEREPMDELTESGERGDPFDYGSLTRRGYHDEMVRAFVSFRCSPEWFLKQYLAGTLERKLQLPEGHLKKLFPTDRAFIDDLDQHHVLFSGMVFKRIQSVPGALVDKRSFGYDYRESILDPYFTKRYEALKSVILAKER